MTRVLVGIISNDAARFSEFWSCVLRLKVPAGSVKEQVIGGDWCSARNELAQRCVDENYDFLWFMDDDHSFAPDLLQKLLDAAVTYDLPVVNPLCTMRTAPFHLVTFAANPDPESKDRYLPISLEGLPGEGIVELEAGGCAGMLIRQDVLVALDGNWFEHTDRSEDIVFCEKAKAAGFPIHADLSCRLGHITTAVITPGLTADGWVTGITVGRDMQLNIGTAEQLLQQAVLEEDEMKKTKGLEVFVEPPAAERIEIWLDDEFMWWWRAIGHDGMVLAKGSSVNEQTTIDAALAAFPGVDVHQVQREVDDSRSRRQYASPGRMWNREVL